MEILLRFYDDCDSPTADRDLRFSDPSNQRTHKSCRQLHTVHPAARAPSDSCVAFAFRKQGRSMLRVCLKLKSILQRGVLTCCGGITAVRKRGTFDAMPQVAVHPSDVGLGLLKGLSPSENRERRCYTCRKLQPINPSIRCGS